MCCMDTIDWLRKYAPGFQVLSEAERDAYAEFLFLWSLFEAKALNEHGSARAIVASSARWARNGQLTTETFGHELAYFRNRYVEGGQFNHHFDHLHLRDNDAALLVQRVLLGEDGAPREHRGRRVDHRLPISEQPLPWTKVVVRATGTV